MPGQLQHIHLDNVKGYNGKLLHQTPISNVVQPHSHSACDMKVTMDVPEYSM